MTSFFVYQLTFGLFDFAKMDRTIIHQNLKSLCFKQCQVCSDWNGGCNFLLNFILLSSAVADPGVS